MAQLVAFRGALSTPGMPYVPTFQFWATQGRNGTSAALVPQPPPGFQGAPGDLGGGFLFYFLQCIANTAHALLGKTITIKIGGGPAIVFTYTETGGGPDTNILITNGATATAVATATAAAINTWATANAPQALVAGADGLGVPSIVEIACPTAQVPLQVSITPAVAGFTLTNNAGRVYGDILLRRAWRAFCYNGYDPAGVNNPFVGHDVGFGLWPLSPVKTWPLVPFNVNVNAKVDG